jgi:hypothetical protein
MHSFLMTKTIDNIDIIDHINNNRLDNRILNLRSVSASTNSHNRKKVEGCSSQYIGVSKKGNKWRAMIRNQKSEYLGLFDNEVDAAKAYNEKAKEIYGENAKLNVLTE